MVPRTLILRNFMCYREEVPPLEFDGLGIACLSGENGAGKSALLDAMTWALWGEARLKSDDELIALGADEMSVEFIFTLDQQDYRVIRRRSKGKRGRSDLDFQVRNNGTWKVIGAETIRETQQSITSTLRMGYDTFANSAFLRQGRADEFTRKEPAKRKQVLADILGLDVYEGLEARAKERSKELDGAIKVLDGRMTELTREAEQYDTWVNMVATAERIVDERTAELQEAQEQHAQAIDAVQELEKIVPLRDEANRQLQHLHAERAERQKDVQRLQQTIADAQAMLERGAEIRSNAATLRATQQELERLELLRGDYEQLVEQRRGVEQAIYDIERSLQTDLRIAEGQLRGLQERANRAPQLQQQQRALEQQLDTFQTVLTELTRQRERRQEVQNQRNEVARLQLQQKDLEKQIAVRHNSLVATREEKKRVLRDLNERLQALEAGLSELATITAERDTLQATEQERDTLLADEREMQERVSTLKANRTSIKAQGDDIKNKLAMLQHDADSCPLCGSELGHAGMAQVEATYNEDITQLRQQYSLTDREVKTLEQQLIDMQGQTVVLEKKLKRLPIVLGKLSRMEHDEQEAQKLRQRLDSEQRTHDDVAMQIMRGDYEHATRGELSRVEAALAAFGTTDRMERELARLDQQIAKLDEQRSQQRAIQTELAGIERELAAIATEAEQLDEVDAQVQSLRTTLGMGEFAQSERKEQTRIERALAKLAYHPDDYTAARTRVRELAPWADEERLLERAEALIERDTQALQTAESLLSRTDREITARTADRDELQSRLVNLLPAQRRRDEQEGIVRERQRTLNVVQRDLGEKQSRLQRSETARIDLMQCENQRKAHVQRKGLFDELTGAFSKKGVQALLIEAAIPEIEREANVLLARMTDNQMHLALETQRGTKKGDVAETLDIRIADALGTRDYDAYSGGESFRVDFALRIALAKLLAHRAGARLETLVIDEGFGSQDAKGRERLVEAITSVQPDFKQILVVTHIQELKDMFPVQIEVSKTQEGSRWALG